MSISALLSQVLVAFTLEFDNEFELQMSHLGYPGAVLSRLLWTNLVRFIPLEGLTVRDLAKRSSSSASDLKTQLGCLERWRYAQLILPAEFSNPAVKREGWGSGRGINLNCVITLTSKGHAAQSVWAPLGPRIEAKWLDRFGSENLSILRNGLEVIASAASTGGTDGVGNKQFRGRPCRDADLSHGVDHDDISNLMSRALKRFQIEFDSESKVPLELCANTIRVLGTESIRESEIPRLTGTSPETSGIGWQAKPYVHLEPDPCAKRGKVVRLSDKGVVVRQAYVKLLAETESRWRDRYGASIVDRLIEDLLKLFETGEDGNVLIATGLIPLQGTVRAGKPIPSLGQKQIGPAAMQRARDMANQTQEFLRDPSRNLPHFPLWDMNRGFGP